MQNQKKIWGSVIVFAVLTVCTLTFQNCAPSSTESASTSTDTNTSSGDSSSTDTAILTYPNSGTPVTLIPGQSITLKMTKPSYMSNAADYLWIVPSDDYALASYYGLFTEVDGYLYVSLTVKSSYASVKNMRLYTLNIATNTYADTTGIGIKIDASAYGQHFSGDMVSEMCDVRGAYVPTFIFDKTKAAADALIVFDNGAGVGSLECNFGGTSVDCLTTSAWPSDWASRSLTITGYNRCGATTTRTF
ncbi:hypothetical protein EZJ49_08640 [Bdellovibrio bacteriovorus]|uniref:hypothetical protein n=1 Tax=Bdellovibrio bacteriovorus TaxID=959 RepID=UPI0021D14855|nr:hypothetical protein [Bdellovibrio bacteriovorus]UXR63142.1 hypothetical protein EZJ49_08640 [Bdellovibrio bacteriovorus]